MKTGNKKFVKTVVATASGSAAMMMLTGKAKKVVSVAKPEKESVSTTGEVSDAIDTVSELTSQIKALTKKQDDAKAIIKEFGKKIEIENIEKNNRSKESFTLKSATGKTILYGVQDNYKYANLDAERIAYLKETYGEAVVATKTTFIINPELIDKYGAAICEFIQTSPLISDEEYNMTVNDEEVVTTDREQLIQTTQVNRITKGTIHNLAKIAKAVSSTVAAMWEEFSPVHFVKERGSK